jgi:hypothetical protein
MAVDPMSRKLSRPAALMAFLWGLLVPTIAAACPVCANGETGGAARKVALGVFIFLPFVVVGTILFILRSAMKREVRHSLPSSQRTIVQRSEA